MCLSANGAPSFWPYQFTCVPTSSAYMAAGRKNVGAFTAFSCSHLDGDHAIAAEVEKGIVLALLHRGRHGAVVACARSALKSTFRIYTDSPYPWTFCDIIEHLLPAHPQDVSSLGGYFTQRRKRGIGILRYSFWSVVPMWGLGLEKTSSRLPYTWHRTTDTQTLRALIRTLGRLPGDSDSAVLLVGRDVHS